MSSAPRYNPHYTVSDYQHWEGDWELWNGVAVSMTPSPSFDHQRLATRLTFLIEMSLRQQAGCGCVVVHETDWQIAEDMVVRPDVCVLCQPVESQFITLPPTLVAEVLSPSTRAKDTGSKAELYARQGVRYYLVIDPDADKCDVFKLTDDRYELLAANDRGEYSMTLHERCALSLGLATLFDRE